MAGRKTFTPISFFCDFSVYDLGAGTELSKRRTHKWAIAVMLLKRSHNNLRTILVCGVCDCIESKTESARLTWLRLLMSYSQETTMHGVRYITEPNSFLCRRFRVSDFGHNCLRNFNNTK